MEENKELRNLLERIDALISDLQKDSPVWDSMIEHILNIREVVCAALMEKSNE